MSEYRVVKRSDVPIPKRGSRGKLPQARLHKTGTLYLSVLAIEALGNQDCLVMVEFDDQAMILKLTAIDQPPRGISREDLFQVRVRTGKRNKRPLGMLYLRSLLRYIGCPLKESTEFPVAAVDPVHRSISLVVPVPVEQVSCDGSSN